MNFDEFLEKHKDERQRCEIWSRVMGYHRPVQSYNKGKLGEFNDRKFFKEPNRKYTEEASK